MNVLVWENLNQLCGGNTSLSTFKCSWCFCPEPVLANRRRFRQENERRSLKCLVRTCDELVDEDECCRIGGVELRGRLVGAVVQGSDIVYSKRLLFELCLVFVPSLSW